MIREIGWFRIVFIYTDKKSIQKKMMSTAGNALSFLFVPMGQITNTPKGVVRFFPTPHCNIYVFLYHSVRFFFGKHFNGLIIPFILLWDYRYLRPCACYLCRPKGAWSRVARAFQDRTSFVAKDKDLGQSQQRSVCRTKTMRTRSYRWGTKRTILYSYTNFNQVFAFFFLFFHPAAGQQKQSVGAIGPNMQRHRGGYHKPQAAGGEHREVHKATAAPAKGLEWIGWIRLLWPQPAGINGWQCTR